LYFFSYLILVNFVLFFIPLILVNFALCSYLWYWWILHSFSYLILVNFGPHFCRNSKYLCNFCIMTILKNLLSMNKRQQGDPHVWWLTCLQLL
jgi:hypothetical protein